MWANRKNMQNLRNFLHCQLLMSTCPSFVVPGFDGPAFVGPGFVGSPISTVQEGTGSLLTERGINKQYTDHLQCIEWRLQATLGPSTSVQ